MTSTHHNTSERFSASLTEDGRYRLLVEAVTDYAIYMLDKEGIVSSWNAGAQRFTGYEATEIIGKHFSQFYTEEGQANGLPQRGLDIAAREGKFEGEGWRIRKDGTRFWTHVVIDPIRDFGWNALRLCQDHPRSDRASRCRRLIETHGEAI